MDIKSPKIWVINQLLQAYTKPSKRHLNATTSRFLAIGVGIETLEVKVTQDWRIDYVASEQKL